MKKYPFLFLSLDLSSYWEWRLMLIHKTLMSEALQYKDIVQGRIHNIHQKYWVINMNVINNEPKTILLCK